MVCLASDGQIAFDVDKTKQIQCQVTAGLHQLATCTIQGDGLRGATACDDRHRRLALGRAARLQAVVHHRIAFAIGLVLTLP